uniref:Bassoon (presynaptic cytomatrix protein) b n=1 Tax=Pygocentrus nattereri TaxID=42514 RepID=A0A3B4BZX8_PYGNA
LCGYEIHLQCFNNLTFFFFFPQKKEWLCLNCQTERLMSGGIDDSPLPVPHPSPKHQPMGSPRHQAPAGQQPAQQPPFQKVSSNQQQGPKAMPPQQKAPAAQESGPIAAKLTGDMKPTSQPSSAPTSTSGNEAQKKDKTTSKLDKEPDDQDIMSPQSLSDTGYSSDGISSSHSEITGLIQEEEIKLSERGLSGHHTPPSPSEITKLESSMRPLLESKLSSEGQRTRDKERGRERHHRDTDDRKQRSHSLSISPEEYDSDEELEDIMEEEEDPEEEMEDEEEEEEEEDEGYEKRRLTHHSSSFEEESKTTSDIYKGSAEEGEEDIIGSQGGLRRFKTIELNNTSSYSRDMELSNENDLNMDREPELEMESLTGSPEERSRGEYSSTLPPTTSSYTSGTSPTSVSSMEDDSDSSPSRRQRLEEAKQQRKARHRSHGPLLPTIEDSSEEDELREEEELLREQEKMREVEQQRIRSTARKTKRDKEELRAQRRRERSKTPPSNLSPIEDASPTEELRQAAEMEELHRSSCSEYSPSVDSEAEGYEMSSKLYKSGSEYNLPTFMSLYSPTEKPETTSSTTITTTSSSGKPLKSAEEVYEEMMRKAEMLQKQQKQQQQSRSVPQYKQSNALLTPGTSPTQLSAPVSFSETGTGGRIPDVRVTQHFSKDKDRLRKGRRMSDSRVQMRDSATPPESVVEPRTPKVYAYYKGSPPLSPTSPPTHSSGPTSPVKAQATQTPHRAVSPRLFRQQSSQDAPFMVITIGSEPSSPSKPVTVNTATSPLSSPTRFSRQSTFDAYSPPVSPPDTPPHQQSPQHGFYRTHKIERVNVGTSMVTTASTYTRGSLSMENISLCRISTVPGTSRVEQGQRLQSASVVDLRTATKSAPIIMTDQGMDLTSLATESRRYSGSAEGSPIRHSTTIQPLIMNLNAQEQPHVIVSTATTVSVTVAASMFISQPKHPVVYGDPLHNRVDFGQGMGTVVCLAQNKPPPVDPSIPNIDAKLEDLSIQQQQLLKQQQKLQQQQQLLEQQLQQHHQLQQQQAVSFTKLNLSTQLPLLKKDLLVSQTSTAPVVSVISPAVAPEMYSIGGPLEVRSKPAEPGAVNLTTVQPHVMMVQADGTAQGAPMTQLIKPEEGQDAMDLTGQIKKDNQVACCDVVYNLPFGGSCVGGPFSQKPMAEETTNVTEPSRPPSAPPQLYQPLQSKQDRQPYQDFALKSYTLPFPGRLQPSMSETNLAEAGLQSYSSKLDPHLQVSGELAMDLSSVKHGYEGGYFGMGLQYGSYTDLRQGDVSVPPLPMRRYSSLSNISSDYGYSSRDLASFQEANLAQYSATTAREISRMCAALNSMDRYGSNPNLLQLGTGRGGGPPSRINVQQGPRPSFMYGPDGKPLSLALTNLINARQASLRAMYPSAIRSADGMIYSTINTPIASTVPITTQPASVLRPLLRGVYRPYATPNMTPVPLASLSRMPVAPRMPLTGQAPYRFPAPSHLPVTTSEAVAVTTEQDVPVYLGKSPVSSSTSGTTAALTQTTPMPVLTQVVAPAIQSHPQQQPMNLSQPYIHTQPPAQQPPTSQPQPPPAHSYPPTQLLTQSVSQPPPLTQATATTATALGGPPPEKETDEERLHRQQEQLLQLERERVELEKLRQLRLQEDLERERAELQRHREKEHMLVQREIQELQNIKQQVLQQQQVERESQLVMQREQLAQQKQQLDQIQSLQQQLQQHLEEQKRQKTAAAVAAVSASTQLICDQTGRIIQPQDLPPDMQYGDIQVSSRSLPNSSSEMCLRNNEGQADNRSMRKQRSMPRLQDGVDGEVTMFSLPRRIVDSSVQTDDEDGEDRYLMSRRRRTRRSVDCSVQTDDDEDKAEWEQPVRRRRSRFSRHSESGVDSKNETPTSTAAAKVASSSIAIQTIRDCSCQTEIEQLGRISPAIHVTVPDPNKVEIVHYISGPERTQKGQSLACQTDPEAQSQGVVVPQISVATTISPYSSSVQLVGSADPMSPRQQGVAKFERRKPDPLDIGYQQHHLHNESLSSVIRQPPKSPQVLYSPVSPLSSPHRIIETSFSSSERLNKAHVTPQQKSYTAESPQRHQSLPRPMKNVQRSMSDPKPLSPTTDEQTKARISLYQQQALHSQLAALQQSSLLRKVKRTLPSPPPEETQLPMVAPALPQMYVPSVPSLKAGSRPSLAAKASLLKDLTHELKAVEQESTKLRKQQAELEEEEKEIDAKLRYLEMGITQRKETLVKERERRELAYLRCMGDARDYMSDSELNNLRLAAAAASFESNGLLTRPSTAPLSQFTSELNTAAQFPPTSSFVSYQYPQSQSTAPAPQASTFQSTGFNQPPYPTVSQAQALPQPTPIQTHHPTPSYQAQGTFPSQSFPQSQPPYPTDHPVLPPTQPSHPGFQPPPQPPASTYQPPADILTVHQRPRQTSLADLEHKMPTNYEVISNPTVVVTTTAQDSTYTSSYGQYTTTTNTYGQATLSDHLHSVDSPSTYTGDGLYGSSNLEQNVPRNYVMIDDISELTKEGMGTTSDPHRSEGHGRYGGDGLHTRGGSSYGRPEDERDAEMYDHHHGRGKSTGSYQARGADTHGRVVGSSSMGGGSSYYYDDYKHSTTSRAAQRHSSKSLAPAVMSTKRSKHRKQGLEQKISKFSPIEEARDVEADLASYTMSTSTTSGYGTGSRSRKLQDEIYGLRQTTYDSHRGYYDDERLYGYGRSRSTGYGMDKISSRETGYRSRSYERDYTDRSYRSSYGRSGRPTLRSQYSEEESPLSPMGKLMGSRRGYYDPTNPYGSSHSLPDVQDHIRDLPRTHVYKPDDMYIIDDMYCAVSDSEAYHLGQEETDWFEKPRDVRGSRHYGSSHSSSGRRGHVKHTYHDYDEPPEEDLWPQDEYGHSRHTSSREHRHHGSGSSGRHSSSRHSDEPRSSRSSRSSKDQSMRHDSRSMSSSSGKRGDSRSQGYHSSDYSRDPSGHHHGSRSGKQSSHHQSSSSRKQQDLQGHPSTSRQPGSTGSGQRAAGGPSSSSRQPGSQQPPDAQQGQRTQLQQQAQTSAARPGQQTPAGGPVQPQPAQGQQLQAKPGQTGPAARQPVAGAQPAPATAKPEPAPITAIGAKAATTQPAKAAQPPLTGIGSKAAPRPGGIGSAAAGQPGMEGESMLSKILPGGAAEQAGKLGEGEKRESCLCVRAV